MEILDKRKRDRMIRGIISNCIILIASGVYIIMIILPKYTETTAMIETINNTVQDISSLKKDGVNKQIFTDLLARQGKTKEIPATIFTNPEKLDKALRKPIEVKTDYLSWLIEENGKINLLDKEIQLNNQILGNIIPVFINWYSKSGINDIDIGTENDINIDHQITIRSFISYIEKHILEKYSFTSYAPIGIANISFPDKKDTSVNIGSFKITLDFKAKNNDIISFIDATQQSGKLAIRNGKLSVDSSINTSTWNNLKWLSSLSNLLIGINSLSLVDMPTILSAENNGTIVLEFYVEGMNYQKVLVLRSLLLAKFDSLQKLIKEKWSLCAKSGNPLCNDSITNGAVTTIKGLIKNMNTLQQKFDAFRKGDITIDINKEMDVLSELKASLESIEMTYLKNNALLEKAKKQPTTK